MSNNFYVYVPVVPGSVAVCIAITETLNEARKIAAKYHGRKDLKMQDIVITRKEKRVEFAGPCR